jgi:hypothetical protein
MKLSNSVLIIPTVALSLSLAACGGGGGSPPPAPQPTAPPTPIHTVTPTATPTATPSATPTATASVATASGTVVDNNANTGLAGVTVAIAPASSNSATSPTPVTTTAASGTFAFTAAPGSYLLVIGSNSATDTRSTYHGEITLKAGANTLAMGAPSPEPDVTLSPAQTSGTYRLETLTSSQSSCLSGANSGRTADALPLLIPDESLLEIADAFADEEVGQNTDTPSPLFNSGANFESSFGTAFSTSANFNPCSQWTGTGYSYVSGNPPYGDATNASYTLYGADLFPSTGGMYSTYGAQVWGEDPRVSDAVASNAGRPHRDPPTVGNVANSK